MRTLLIDVGFDATEFPQNWQPGSRTRFSMDLCLPEDAVEAFWAGFKADKDSGGLWSFDALNALHRWFDERLAQDRNDFPHDRGQLLASCIGNPSFYSQWLIGEPEAERAIPKHLQPAMKFFILHLCHWNFDSWVYKALRDAERRLKVSSEGRLPGDLVAVSRDATVALLKIQPPPQQWPNPLMGLWFAISRLSRTAPGALQKATGVATMRWQPNSEQSWEAPECWRLTNGIRAHERNTGQGIFPIVQAH
jgi:hypothetical protein